MDDYVDHEHLPSVVMEQFLADCDWDLPSAIERAAAENGYVFTEFYRDSFWGAHPEGLAPLAAPVWHGTHNPLPWSDWRILFDLAGYTEDGLPAARPTEPLLLWRGSVSELRHRPSWTPDNNTAAWFAVASPFQRDLGIGELWWAVVEPWRLLARIDYEYVVNTDGLAIYNESHGPF